MNKLKKLIDELYASEVEYRSLGSMMNRIREKGHQDSSVNQVYVVSNTKGMVKAEEYRENTIHSEDTSNYTIIRKDMVAYNPSRLNIGSIAMLNEDEPGLVSPMYVVFEIDQDIVLKEYFEYLMKSTYVASMIDAYKEEGARFRFDFSRWNWIKVPIPSKAIQKDIIEVLDDFSEYISLITTELEYRKIQFEHYKTKLVEDAIKNCEDTTIRKIADSVTVGIANSATHAYADQGVIMFRNQNIKENLLDDSDLIYIKPDFASKYKNKSLKENDILVTRTGYPGQACIVPKKYEGCQTFTTLILRLSNLELTDPQFICYYINSSFGKAYVDKTKTGAAQQNFGAKLLEQMPIRIPSIDIQRTVVKKLDSFNELCNNPEYGLPAEIKYRTQQFEYYRDFLLTFAKKRG